MRRRGLASPDDGDALALTFAYPVAKKRLGRGAAVRGRAAEAEEVGQVIVCWERATPVAQSFLCCGTSASKGYGGHDVDCL